MNGMCYQGNREYSSFRDPSSVVFEQDGVVYRRIYPVYVPHYEHFMRSGLYHALLDDGLIASHEQIEERPLACGGKEILLCPKQIPFISYPYEWCFEQYRDAALVTLNAQRKALQFGMTLKDASAYNVQFYNGRAVLIDTPSFETYSEGPWAAYGQFCRHFFAPLFLMAHLDVRAGKMMQSYIDGIPLDLADTLLRGKGGFSAWQHIRLHAGAVRRFGGAGTGTNHVKKITLKKEVLAAIIDSLIRSIRKLKQKDVRTEWGDYYSDTNYNDTSAQQKEMLTGAFLDAAGPIKTAWDFGANDGRYSRLALERGAYSVAFDIDPVAVCRNYLTAKEKGESLLPLLLDLTAPSPAIGFANRERKTIAQRRKPDITLMLALIHHLAIANNLSFAMIAEWLASFTPYLIIEFVPKEDSQVRRLLKTRTDIFPDYTQTCFERAFGEYFEVMEKQRIEKSERIMYLFRAK
ncbi:MAG: hypothetical protein LBD07_05275 [Spirochaetaceae bacterium]|jgi:hypothetical protein|nr:hypothetical protein [Spirochaetaceae bacterium]